MAMRALVQSEWVDFGVLPERLKSHVKPGIRSTSIGDTQEPTRHTLRGSERKDKLPKRGNRLSIGKLTQSPAIGWSLREIERKEEKASSTRGNDLVREARGKNETITREIEWP